MNMETILKYIKRGLLVFPLHTPTEQSGCSCNNPKCSSIGKHPRTMNGFKDATTNLDQIKSWWGQWPDANIGIRTGKETGFIVLDVDPRNGGDKSLAELEKQYDALPKTVEADTGGSGRHLFFAYPNVPIKCGANVLGTGLDIKGDGGYIVAPPSKHASGKSYNWKFGYSPEECELAVLPVWLEKLLTKNDDSSTPTAMQRAAVIPEGQRNNRLTKIAGLLQSKGLSDNAILSALTEENKTKCSPPLDQAEVQSIATSVCKYPKGELVVENKTTNKNTENYIAHFQGLVDLVEKDGKIIFLTTDGLKDEVIVDGKKYLPPPKDQILWLLPEGEACLRYVKEDNDSCLYDELVKTAKSVSILPSEEHYHLLAAWIMHTYYLDHENYSPILIFDAAPDRGKSRTGKFLTSVSYRGIRVAEMREANLIRFSTNFRSTIFFDLKDACETARKNSCADLMLNRFEKGAKATRTLYPEKGAFKDMKNYDIFGATLIATNKGLDYILESRGITIVMPEAEGKELEHFDKDIVPEDFLALKARLIAFKFRRLNAPLAQIEKPAKKRLGDIMRPLVRIVRGVKPEAEYHLLNLIAESEKERQLSKSQTQDGQILRCFFEHAKVSGIPNGEAICVEDIKCKINKVGTSYKDQLSSHKIGRCIKKVGFKRARGSNNTAAYSWDSELAKKLAVTWGLDQPFASPNSQHPQESEILDKNIREYSREDGPVPF